MNLLKRKSNRLKEYDYSANGAYFITICTKSKECILSKIVGEGLCALPQNELTPIGQEVEKAIKYIDETYPHASVDNYVIMPNHVHLIISLNSTGGHGDPPLQGIIGRFKSYTTHKYTRPLWQRSYHDHIIRSDEDYAKVWEYIEHNALKWEQDKFYVK